MTFSHSSIFDFPHLFLFIISSFPLHFLSIISTDSIVKWNHVAGAANFAITEYNMNRIAIIDWDIHHGNGTQDIFQSTDNV
jgi:hypothetical protein